MMVQIEENSCNNNVADLKKIDNVIDNETTIRSIYTLASVNQSRIAWYICTGAISFTPDIWSALE
jgi:hypothetical protein